MKLGRYEKDNKIFLGVEKEEHIINLSTLFQTAQEEDLKTFGDMKKLIEKWEIYKGAIEKLLAQPDDYSPSYLNKDEVNTLAPIINPGKLVCVGNNYMDHCIEQNVEPPEKPMIFSKWASCIIGPNDLIVLPEDSEQVDYEAELAVIIGKGGKNISIEDAIEHVFGYTIINDVSARDVQFADVQWVRGKSYDTFAPLGPVIVTREEIENPNLLDIKLQLNDSMLQDSNTKHLIFDIPYIISYLSKGFTFEPGDIIATGTPHGVGIFRNPPVYLAKGDVCEIEIEQIGSLKNTIS